MHVCTMPGAMWFLSRSAKSSQVIEHPVRGTITSNIRLLCSHCHQVYNTGECKCTHELLLAEGLENTGSERGFWRLLAGHRASPGTRLGQRSDPVQQDQIPVQATRPAIQHRLDYSEMTCCTAYSHLTINSAPSTIATSLIIIVLHLYSA